MSESYSFRWGLPKEYQWTDIPNFILFNYAELGVTNVQMMLIVHLATFYHDTEDSEGSHPSTQTIADRMGVAYATAFENLKALEAGGWVIINRRPGYPSIYDFSPLTNACLELQQSKPVTGGSQENLRGRVSGKSETGGSQENLRRKEESSKQELQNENPPPPPPFSLGPKTQPQPEPTPNTTHATKATGQSMKDRSSAQAISKSVPPVHPLVSTQPPTNLTPHKLPMAFLRSIPLDWTWTHIYIYQQWYHPDWKKAAYQTRIDAVTKIYKAVSTKCLETPLTTLTMASYVDWYYQQDWLIRKAREKGMSTPRDWNLPAPDNLASSLADWQPTRLPAYTPREYTAPPERSNPFSLGGGV